MNKFSFVKNNLTKSGVLFFFAVCLATFLPCLYAQEKDNPIDIVPKVSYLSDFELGIWNDTTFKKKFAESYLSETEIEPSVTIDEREQMQEVLELFSEDDLDGAAKLIEEEFRNEAASAVFDFTLANIYFQQEKFDKAIEAYNVAIEKFPKFRRAYKNLGMIYIQQGKFKEAIPVLTKVIELGGGDGLLYGFLGYAYSSVENSISAESAYRMAIMLDSQTLDWKMGLARSFFRQQRYSEAAALCDILLKKYPDRSDLWLLQANAYIGQNKPVKAAQIFEMVNQLGKSTVASLNLLGDIYVNEELFDLAADSYIKAMEKEDDAKPDRAIRSCKILAARGAHEQTNKLIEYIEANKADLLSKEERKDLLKLRARLAVASGNADKEVEILEKIVEIDPLDGEALLLLGQHSKKSGDMEAAVYYYQRAQNIEDFEADALVRHAQLLVTQGKYSEAVTLLRRAQQIEHRENIQKYLEQVERVAKGR